MSMVSLVVYKLQRITPERLKDTTACLRPGDEKLIEDEVRLSLCKISP